jgi:glycerol kinase
MPNSQYIIALDQGTTSSRAVLLNSKAEIIGIEQQEFTQIFPQAGWVEHDPKEILTSQLSVLSDLVAKHTLNNSSIVALGITNQRETTVVWDRKTGNPIYNAIVWQDKRTTSSCEELKSRGLSD